MKNLLFRLKLSYQWNGTERKRHHLNGFTELTSQLVLYTTRAQQQYNHMNFRHYMYTKKKFNAIQNLMNIAMTWR